MGGGSTLNSIENTQNNTLDCTKNHTQNNKSTQDSTPSYINNTSQNHTNQNDINKRYEPKNEQTLLEILGYKSAQTITFQSFLQRAKERNINNFWWAWQGMIDFRFLQKINLQFYEGIIHEDHLFGAFLFAQSRAIAIIPQKLYHYRIRKGSTMSAWSKDEIPSYVKPFCAHFPYQKARAYFRIYSLVVSVQGLVEFAKTHFTDEAHQTKNSNKNSPLQVSQKQAQNDFLALTLPLLLEIICEIFYFYKDPYHLKAQTAKIIKDLGAESSMLPGRVRKYFALYTRHWKVLWGIGVLKRVERKIRRFIKN